MEGARAPRAVRPGVGRDAGIGLVVHAIAVVLILRQARRIGMQRVFTPDRSTGLEPVESVEPGAIGAPAGSAFDADGRYRWENDRPTWAAPLG